jgi:hypothetical protein
MPGGWPAPDAAVSPLETAPATRFFFVRTAKARAGKQEKLTGTLGQLKKAKQVFEYKRFICPS